MGFAWSGPVSRRPASRGPVQVLCEVRASWDRTCFPVFTGTPGLPTVTLTYNYDPAGNETSLTDSLGGVVSYTYDARNELTNETFSGTGLSAEAVTYTYDPRGNLTGLTRYSNLAETTVVASTTIAYDAANQLTGITDKNSGGTTLVLTGTRTMRPTG